MRRRDLHGGKRLRVLAEKEQMGGHNIHHIILIKTGSTGLEIAIRLVTEGHLEVLAANGRDGEDIITLGAAALNKDSEARSHLCVYAVYTNTDRAGFIFRYSYE